MGRIPGNPNHTFKYSTATLLEKLKENRENHKKNFDIAMKKYRETIQKELEAKLKLAKQGKDVKHSIQTIRPVEYLTTYDRFIDMFTMMVETEIELDSETFAQLVRDEWDWSHSFEQSTLMYSAM
jgi:hypothetical protein